MSAKRNELPRDLRALLCGNVNDSEGSELALFYPAKSYANLCEVRKELEHDIADPDILPEHVASLQGELELVKRLQAEIKQRIINHFAPRPHASNSEDRVDHGAKQKLEKAVADAEAGRCDRRKSKTLKAVLKALAYCEKNGRMPSHGELKELGFNDQQATDAGWWLERQADPEPDEQSLFRPLHQPKRGRPKKK